MPSFQAVPAANRLRAALPRENREQLLAHCEPFEPVFAEVLYRAGEHIPHVYFATGSVISLVAPIDGGTSLEAGLIGNEGMPGMTLMRGLDVAPFHALVQGPGPAPPMTALLPELEQCPPLRREVKRYLHVSINQFAQTAAGNRFHAVSARPARWLLMNQDRAHSDTPHVTHVFLAYMLGVRRVGITKAANSLQQRKLVRYQRGVSPSSTAPAWKPLRAGVTGPTRNPASASREHGK